MELEQQLFSPEETSEILGGLLAPSGLSAVASAGLVPHVGGGKYYDRRLPLRFHRRHIDFIIEHAETLVDAADEATGMEQVIEQQNAPEPFRTTARSRALHGRKAA